MDRPFDSDLIDSWADESPINAADEALEDFDEMGDGADAGEDAFSGEMDGFEMENEATYFTDDGFVDEAVSGFSDEFSVEFGEVDFGEVDQEVDGTDAMEVAIADALGAEDTDEFVRRLRRVANVARRIGRGVGQVARVVAPIASAIPLPQAQAIGRIASVAGRLLFEGADEFEALDAVLNLAEQEDAVDAAIPVIAGLTIRSVMPRVARTPQPMRRQLVRTVSQSTRLLVRRQGPQAARAIAPVVQSVQRTAQQRRLPARQLPQAVQQTARRVATNPRLTRQLVQRQLRTARTTPLTRQSPRAAMGMSRGMPRQFVLQGPVEITISSR